MHPELASLLAEQRNHELSQMASRQRAVARARGSRRPVPAWRVPRYRVHYSRTTLSPAGATGRERSWVIVISASRGL